MAQPSLLTKLQVGTILATTPLLAGGVANAQTPPASTPTRIQHYNIQEQQQQEAVRQDVIQYGDHTMYEIFTNPHFAGVLKDIGFGSGTNYEQNLLQTSPLGNAVYKNTRLSECIDKNAHYNYELESRINDAVPAAIAKMAAQGITVADALKQDSAVAAANMGINKGLYSLFLNEAVHPAIQSFANNAKLKDMFDGNGLPKKQNIDNAYAAVLSKVPLGDLAKPELDLFCIIIGERTHDAQYDKAGGKQNCLLASQLLSNAGPFLYLAGSKFTVGDILTPGSGLVADPVKTKNVLNALADDAINFGKDYTSRAVKNGVSIYDAIANSDDANGVLKYYFSIISSDHGVVPLLQKRGITTVANAIAGEYFKHVPLASVLSSDGFIDDRKLRDMAIVAVKDKTLSEVGPEFLEAVLGPDAAAIVAQNILNNPEDIHRKRMADRTKMGYFITNDDPHGHKTFVKIRQFVNDAYPPQARAADEIGTASNTWPQSKQNGITTIYYSFNVEANKALQKNGSFVNDANGGTQAMPSEEGVLTREERTTKVLTPNEQLVAKYALACIARGVNLQFEYSDKLPAGPDGTPIGIVFSTADLSDEAVYDKGAGSMAGHMASEDNVLGHAELCHVVLDKSYALIPSTMEHEILHAVGLSHDFDPGFARPLPGTKIIGEQYTPGIDNSVTIMSYRFAMNPITPMLGDEIALKREFGAPPANASDTVYTLGEGSLHDIVSHPNGATTIWINNDKTNELAETIMVTGGNNTLDFSTLNGKPVALQDLLDLSKGSNIISPQDRPSTYLSVMGKIQTVIISQGHLKGAAGPGTLEIKINGSINGNGGHKTLVGGTEDTVFTGGPKHSDRIVIHADPQHADSRDFFWDYNPKSDMIIAPRETQMVTLESDPYNKNILIFLGSDGGLLKSLDIATVDAGRLKVADIHVESPDGRKLPVIEKMEAMHIEGSIQKPTDELMHAQQVIPPNLSKTPRR